MSYRFMTGFSLVKSKPLEGAQLVLTYLEDAQRTRALLKVEDGPGREVRASLLTFTEADLTLTTQEPLALEVGSEINLLLFLDGLRFKASTLVLMARPGCVILALPSAIHLAERRRKPRAYMSVCEGAAAIALSGLFSPVLSAAVTAIEHTHSYAEDSRGGPSQSNESSPTPVTVHEPAEGIGSEELHAPRFIMTDGPRLDPLPIQSKDEGIESTPPRAIKIEKPWSKMDVALDSIFWTSFVIDWMQTRTIARNGYTCVSIAEQQVKTSSCEYTVHANQYFAESRTERNPILGRHPKVRKVDTYFALSGITYAFMTRNLPEKWRRAYMVTSVTIEAFCVGNNIRLGVRVR
jgi:hypothetical protein